MPFLPEITLAAAVIWGLHEAGPSNMASLTGVVPQMGWLSSLSSLSPVFFTECWKLSKRIKAEAVRSLEPGLRSPTALLLHSVGQRKSQGLSRFREWGNRFHLSVRCYKEFGAALHPSQREMQVPNRV